MNRTTIEWVRSPDGKRPGYTSNPITGCLWGCKYCYARRLARGRLKSFTLNRTSTLSPLSLDAQGVGCLPEGAPIEAPGDPFYPRFWMDRLGELAEHRWRQPRGVFLCDMGDMFGMGVPRDWPEWILQSVRVHAGDRFYLLTKQPQHLAGFSPFPANCWVGASATDYEMLKRSASVLGDVSATVKYLSLEPWLEKHDLVPGVVSIFLQRAGISWVIIGQQTPPRPATAPSLDQLQVIVQAADQSGIPVFLKNSLMPIFDLKNSLMPEELGYLPQWAHRDGVMRQEMPVAQNSSK